MTHLTTDQLTELTRRINERLGEFGDRIFDPLAPGVVRLTYGIIAEWHEESLSPHKSDGEDNELLTIAYGFGFERGKAAAKPSDTERLFTMSAPVVEPTRTDEVDDDADPIPTPLDGLQVLSSAVGPATNGNGHHLSAQAVAVLGPEHPVITPRVPHKPEKGDALDFDADDLDNDYLDDDEDGDELPAKRVRPNGKRIPRRRAMGYEQAQQVKPPSGTHLPTLDQLIAEVKRQAMAGTMPTMAAFNMAKPATWSTAAAHLVRLGLTWSDLAEKASLVLKRPQ